MRRGRRIGLGEESPLLAGLVSASVQGRVALGTRAGRRVWRLGEEPDGQGMMSQGPRQVHLEGFDLHANVSVSAHNRAGVERLCRYILRPPLRPETNLLICHGVLAPGAR